MFGEIDSNATAVIIAAIFAALGSFITAIVNAGIAKRKHASEEQKEKQIYTDQVIKAVYGERIEELTRQLDIQRNRASELSEEHAQCRENLVRLESQIQYLRAELEEVKQEHDRLKGS